MADDDSGSTWSTWGKPTLIAIGVSLAAYAHITMILFTASYVMNRSIYRHPALRIMTGILAAMTSVITFWVVLFLPRTEFFGLLPIWHGDAGLLGLTNYFWSSYDPGDGVQQEAVKQMVWSSLGWKKDASGDVWRNKMWGTKAEFEGTGPTPTRTKDVLNEKFLSEARAAGALSDKAAWEAKMRELTPLAAAAAPAAAAAAPPP